ncbi:hypothetical protein FS749_005346 [Ceratobasidium sp. UAMH 11750]|nr:hypothetical protein FS749_005346 [Ceratobasidium sp. UAMH 11750]
MSTARVRSKTGCLTCKNRRKKCDETRPLCERCIKAGMECLGYAYLEEASDKSKRPRARPAARATKSIPNVASSSVISDQSTINPTATLAISSLFSPSLPSLQDPPQGTPTGGLWSSLPPHAQENFPLSSTVPDDVLDFSFLSDPASTSLNTQGISAGWWDTNSAMSAQHLNQTPGVGPSASSSQFGLPPLPTPPEPITQSLIPHRPLEASSNSVTGMTPGQASLFQALFSLEQPATSSPLPPSSLQTPPSSHGSTWPSPDTEDDNASATSEESDPEGIREIVCRTPTLDKNAPSNSLPFVLHSYSKWIRWTIFEPLRLANKVRDHLTRRFNQSLDSRSAVTLVANIIQSLSKSSTLDTNYLPAITLIRNRARRNLALADAQKNLPIQPGSREALEALEDMFEVISIQFMSSSLEANMSLVCDAAPVYQNACPEAPGVPINLPAKLLHPEFPLRHFPSLDILFSLGMCRPMLFRYDISFTPELCATLTDIDGVGLQWMHGIPDQFIVLLARMNMLRVDFAPNVDPRVIGEIQAEIKNFRPVLGVSTDPFLTVARLAVQESWRQVLYIYLYMGLCGADASDSRVEKALKGFTRLLEGTKAGRTPDVFLMLPMIVAGVASRRSQDRNLIQSRMLNLRECSQPGTAGHESVLILGDIWTRTDAEARPAVWADLRIAVFTVAGIQ